MFRLAPLSNFFLKREKENFVINHLPDPTNMYILRKTSYKAFQRLEIYAKSRLQTGHP